VWIFGNDSSLVGLCDISEDDVDHSHEEPVVLGFAGVVDDGDDVGSLLGHIDQISAHSVRKFHSVHHSSGSDDVRNVGNSGPWGAAEIEDSASGEDAGLWDATDDWGSDLGSVGVPDAVLNFLVVDFHADALLVVDRLPGDQVLGHEAVLRTAGHEHAGHSVRLHEDFGASGTASEPARSAPSPTAGTATTSVSSETAPTSVSSATASFVVVELPTHINK